jgi:hypothetical protein
MNQLCVEDCASRRDCSKFEPRKDLELEDMPRFPLKEMSWMTREERLAAVTIYLAKVVDHLQGNEYEYTTAIRRPHSNGPTSGRIPPALQEQDLLPDPATEHTVYQAGPERQDQTVGSDQVA